MNRKNLQPQTWRKVRAPKLRKKKPTPKSWGRDRSVLSEMPPSETLQIVEPRSSERQQTKTRRHYSRVTSSKICAAAGVKFKPHSSTSHARLLSRLTT